MNYSNSQRVGVILNFTELLFGACLKYKIFLKLTYYKGNVVKKESKISIWLNFIKSIQLIWKIKPEYISITIFSMLINSIYPVISLTVMQTILNIVQSGNIKFKIIFIYIGIYISIDLIQTIISAISGYYIGKFNLLINLYVKKEVLKKASLLTLKEYENSDTYDIIQRAQNESEGKITTYFNLVISVFGTIITVGSYLALLLAFKAWLVFFVLTIPLFKYILLKKINLKQFHILISRTNEERKTWYYSYLMTNGNYNKEMKLYKLYEFFLKKFELNRKKFMSQDVQILKESTGKITALSVVEQILDGAIFGYIIYNGVIGIILLGDVVTYTRAVIQTKSSIQAELNNFAEIEKQSLYLEQLFLLLEKEVSAKENEGKEIENIDRITTVGLSYRYNNNEKYVLRNVNLDLNKGYKYAILGKNGSGKTTLAKILMGFYDDYEGEIFINGLNLRNINKESYRSKIGALFQDFGRYEASIRENIAYGNLNLINDDDSIKNIAKEFDIFSLIENNQYNLETQLGYWFDEGKQVSVGQWQKIALCRAFIKNADVYILDEPNAALDAISEYHVAQLYKKVLDKKLGIIIAHKFGNFIQDIDEIFVMEAGEVIEQGSHEKLLSESKLYKRLYELQ